MQRNLPLYLQVEQDLEDTILSGRFMPGQDIPPIRTLAVTYQVNPNTIQRALSLLREAQLIQPRHQRLFVTSDACLICRRRAEKVRSLALQLYDVLSHLGYTRDEIFNKLLPDASAAG